MRNKEIDKLALLVVAGMAVMVALAAAGSGPAYSDESRTGPAELHRGAAVEASAVEIAPAPARTEPTGEESGDQATILDSEGYEWSGSRPADQRYLWSHRPN